MDNGGGSLPKNWCECRQMLEIDVKCDDDNSQKIRVYGYWIERKYELIVKWEK